MNIVSTSAYKFDDPDNLPFDINMYSRMKNGIKEDSDECARILFESFIAFTKTNPDPLYHQIVIAPSPYHELPKASFNIFKTFARLLNAWLFKNNHKMIKTISIRNEAVYYTDYGTLNLQDRIKLIGEDRLLFDSDLVMNNYFIIIDDLKMTGTLEKIMLKNMSQQGITPHTVHFLFFAENVSDKVPEKFENKLNFSAIESLQSYIQIIKNSKHRVQRNMRNVKYVLSLPQKDFLYFIGELDEMDRIGFLNAAIESECILVKEFQNNLLLIRDHMI